MIYVMSDIHGNMARFDSVMKQINLQKEDALYILGDVVDRYPDGIRILRKIYKEPNIKMIIGNHEHMMLEALDCPRYKYGSDDWFYQQQYIAQWYNNGGNTTHQYLKHIPLKIRQEIFNYLKSLPLNYEVEVNGEKYLLVHGAPVETFAKTKWTKAEDEIMHAVWTRIRRFDKMPEGKTVIFGHTPTSHYMNIAVPKIWYGDQKIGIDCGCGYVDGRLACLRLDDMKEFYSERDFDPRW